MNIKQLGFAVSALVLFAPYARADVQVGAKPKLHFTAFDSKKTVDLSDLHGKIVVVDFWATWCHPCMGEAAHMVAVNDKYSSKGLQFLGISLDSDPSALPPVIKDKNFTWPQSYEGKGWDGSLPKEWGVNSIPQTFIIGPDGEVLWRGHPANIDAALEKAFKEHPPILVDEKTLSTAKSALDSVESQLSAGQFSKAAKSLAGYPQAASADTTTAARLKELTDKLQAAGETQLGTVDGLVSAGQYKQAEAELRMLSTDFSGLPVAASAKEKLAKIESDPAVRKQVEAEKKKADSDAALLVADALRAKKQDDAAYLHYKDIVRNYAGTTAAESAATAVKTYESNPNFVAAFTLKVNSKKADSALSIADNYKAAGSLDLAKAKYRDLIAKYPGTPAAATAQKSLDE